MSKVAAYSTRLTRPDDRATKEVEDFGSEVRDREKERERERERETMSSVAAYSTRLTRRSTPAHCGESR